MQNLFNELNAPVITYNDKGEQVQTAPTSLSLRAAKALKQLADINDQNNVTIRSLQVGSQENFNIIEQLRKQIESIQQDGRKASDVGSSRVPDQRSDSTSEEGNKPEGDNPSSS